VEKEKKRKTKMRLQRRKYLNTPPCCRLGKSTDIERIKRKQREMRRNREK
jgi:hypothetical protein